MAPAVARRAAGTTGRCAGPQRARAVYPAGVRLVIVRHAEAAPGEPDELRPLTDAGRRAARLLGERLAQAAPLDAVLCSPLLRARETATAIARASGLDGPEVAQGLAPGATSVSVLAALAGHGERVAAVGHMPDVAHLAEVLTGQPRSFSPGDSLEVEIDIAS